MSISNARPTLARYFRSVGNRIDCTDLVAIPAADFAEFANYLESHVWPLGLTRDAFAAAENTERDSLKRASPYYVPAVPKGAPARSRGEPWEGPCNLLCLDLDKAEHAQHVIDRLSRNSALVPWPYLVHHTARSTEHAPRVRVIVGVDQIPPSNYAHASSTVARRIGLPSVSFESYEPGRAFYFPTSFAGEHPGQSIIGVQWDGPAFTLACLDEEPLLPVSGRVRKCAAADADELEHLRCPVEGWEPGDAAELLKLFPADDYNDWLDAGMALKHQFREQGFSIWNEWAKTSSRDNYPGEEEARRKWDNDFNANAGNRPSLTWLTFIHRAKTEKGWQPTEHMRRQMARLVTWMKDRARSAGELRDEGTARIAKLTGLSRSQNEELIAALHEELKRADVNIATRILREEVKENRQRHRRDQPDALPPWAKDFCYVGGTVNEFYNVSSGHVYLPQTFDNTYRREMPIGSDMAPHDYVLTACRMRIVQDYAYHPAEPAFFEDSRQGHCVNRYRATFAVRDDSNAAEARRLLERHLTGLIAEEEYRATLMDWFAYQVQSPGKRVHWVPLIQGGQGCGKGTLGDILRDVLGDSNVRFIDSSSLESGFNEWAGGSQVVVLSEVHNVGDKRHKVVNRLKTFVADGVVDLDVKHARPRQVTNVTNYLAFTNHHNAVPLEASDRRFFVLKSPLQTKEQVAPITPQIHELHAFRDAHPGAFRAVLEDWSISGAFNPRGHAPETTYKNDMKEASRSPTQQAIMDTVTESALPYLQEDVFCYSCLMEGLKGRLPTNDRFVRDALAELQYVPLGRSTIDGARYSLWVKRGTEFEAQPELARHEYARRVAAYLKEQGTADAA